MSLGDIISAAAGVLVAAITGIVGWLMMTTRTEQRLADHEKQVSERFKEVDRRFDEVSKRLDREHQENRETLHRIEDKLDLLTRDRRP